MFSDSDVASVADPEDRMVPRSLDFKVLGHELGFSACFGGSTHDP